MELLNCLYSMLQICASSSSFFFLEIVAEIAEFGERWRNDGGVSEAGLGVYDLWVELAPEETWTRLAKLHKKNSAFLKLYWNVLSSFESHIHKYTVHLQVELSFDIREM